MCGGYGALLARGQAHGEFALAERSAPQWRMRDGDVFGFALRPSKALLFWIPEKQGMPIGKASKKVMRRMHIKKLAAVALWCSLFGAAGCYYDNREDLFPEVTLCDTSNVSYSADLLPVLEVQCLGCHNNSSQQGNVNLEGYDNVRIYVQNGGLYGSIAWLDGYSAMPPAGSQLPACTVAKFKAWIEAGAPNN